MGNKAHQTHEVDHYEIGGSPSISEDAFPSDISLGLAFDPMEIGAGDHFEIGAGQRMEIGGRVEIGEEAEIAQHVDNMVPVSAWRLATVNPVITVKSAPTNLREQSSK